MISLADILAAQRRIAPAAIVTPLIRLDPARLRAAGFPSLVGTIPDIYLKNEAAQPIGSFKLRGAYNAIALLGERDPAALARGVITYSSGNHAQGVAFAARALGARAVIVMPSNTPPIKLEATQALGAEIVLVGPASTERKLRAEQLAAAHGYTIIPPYDDPAIIAGQAICGLEILQQLPDADLVLSPVSGGGLLSGVATALKLVSQPQIRVPHSSGLHPDEWGADAQSSIGTGVPSERSLLAGVEIWGCEPELAADATQSFRTRTLTEWPAASTTRTLCDGLRTQSLGALNFEHILRHVDNIITLSEPEIRLALRILLTATDITAEPSGAITLAAALFHTQHLAPGPEPSARKKVVAIVSGGNLDPALRLQLESESLPTPV